MNRPSEDDGVAHYRESLQQLLQQVPALSGAVLARSDGFEVLSVTRGEIPASRLSAISSSMAALGRAALQEMGYKGGSSILIEGDDGKLLLLEVPQHERPMVLALVGSGDVVTGSLLWAARDCVRQLVDS